VVHLRISFSSSLTDQLLSDLDPQNSLYRRTRQPCRKTTVLQAVHFPMYSVVYICVSVLYFVMWSFTPHLYIVINYNNLMISDNSFAISSNQMHPHARCMPKAYTIRSMLQIHSFAGPQFTSLPRNLASNQLIRLMPYRLRYAFSYTAPTCTADLPRRPTMYRSAIFECCSLTRPAISRSTLQFYVKICADPQFLISLAPPHIFQICPTGLYQ